MPSEKIETPDETSAIFMNEIILQLRGWGGDGCSRDEATYDMIYDFESKSLAESHCNYCRH